MSGLSEVDIRDWDRKIQEAYAVTYAIDDDDVAEDLIDFINSVHNFIHGQQKQVAALFKPIGGGNG